MIKIFSNKKLFTVDCVINRRNDRFTVQKGESPPPVCHTRHSQSMMMLGVVASNGEKCPSIYIKEEGKVNTEIYISVLKKHVRPWLKKTFPDGNYVFQEDVAPSHGAKKTHRVLKDNIANL